MFDKIQEIIGRPLNGFEFNKLMRWNRDKEYSDEEVIEAYKYCKSDDINYIQRYLEGQKEKRKINPEWMNKEVQEEPLDKRTLLKIIKEWKVFFDNEEEYKEWGLEQLRLNGYEVEK